MSLFEIGNYCSDFLPLLSFDQSEIGAQGVQHFPDNGCR